MKILNNITLKFFCATILYFFLFSCTVAQNRIVLKDGKVLLNTKLREIKSAYIMYEQSGSLHDLEIENIDYIITNTDRIGFDKNNKPIYSDISSTTSGKSNDIISNTIDNILGIKREGTSLVKTDNVNIPKKFVVKISPTLIINVFGDAGVQAAIENKIKPALMIQNNFSYLFYGRSGLTTSYKYDHDTVFNLSTNTTITTFRKNIRGFAYSFEMRKYYTSNDFSGIYLAPQITYKQIQWQEVKSTNIRSEIYDTTNYTTTYTNTNSFEYTNVMRISYGGNLILGYQYIATSGLTFDIYLGGGVKYRNTAHAIDKNFNFSNGKVEYVPSFAGDIKIGWAF